jgi:hypothetical protein
MNEASHTYSGRSVRILATVGVVVLLTFLTATPALAQDPTRAQYESAVTQVNGNAGSGSSQAPSSSRQTSGLQENVVSGLPFTGLDVVALAAVALALTSIGFALRRMTDPRPH